MRRIIIVALSVALLTTTAWVVHGAAAGSTAQSTRSAAATMRDQSAKALYQSELEQNLRHQHHHPAAAPSGGGGRQRVLASQLARARLATARYATNLHAAKADGYQILTRMIPDMGWHFLNPTIQGFDVTKPPATTRTAPSCSRPRRTGAPSAAPRPAPPSTSGTRTW
jgi:hypothetical protein